MGDIVRVLQKGKITIPVEVRERLGIKEGDELKLVVEGGRIVLLPPKTVLNPTEALDGLAEEVHVREPVNAELRKAGAWRVENKLQRGSE